MLWLIRLNFSDRIQKNQGISHYPEVVNNVDILVSKLFHDSLDLFLPLNFDFILFILLVHPLSEYFENRGSSLAPLVIKFNIVNWWLLETLYQLPRLFIDFIVRVSHINSGLETSFFHQHVDLE